jgi:hypothetical protein
MGKTVFSAIAAVLLLAAPAFAQDKPVEFNVGFGATFPVSNLKNDFDAGWNGDFGVTFFVKPAVGLQAEYGYHHMNGPERTFPDLTPGSNGSVLIESNHHMHIGTFNLVVRSHGRGAAGGYFLVGPGVYHRTIQLTTPSVGFITVCDPYWLICYPTAVSTDAIVGDRSSTDFGMNFGGGITFGHEAKFYVEFRYHYVWGPKVGAVATPVASSGTTSTNVQYFPITFGFRF